MEQEEDYGLFDSMSFEDKIKEVFETNNLLLNEKLFDIKNDIEMLWSGFEHALAVYKKDPKKILDSYKEGMGHVYKLSSKDLTSDICKEAHAKNPVTILIGFLSKLGNAYVPATKTISVTVNKNAVMYLGTEGLDALPSAIELYPNIGKEFEEDSLKGSIAHELSHWLDDSLHNKHISKEIQKYQKTIDDNKPKYTPSEWAYVTNHEIDANIHAIASLKDRYENKWDSISFEDMIKLKPSLPFLFKSIGSKLSEKHYQKFIKRFFGRLVRENLLGKNMKPIPFQDLKHL